MYVAAIAVYTKLVTIIPQATITCTLFLIPNKSKNKAEAVAKYTNERKPIKFGVKAGLLMKKISACPHLPRARASILWFKYSESCEKTSLKYHTTDLITN